MGLDRRIASFLLNAKIVTKDKSIPEPPTVDEATSFELPTAEYVEEKIQAQMLLQQPTATTTTHSSCQGQGCW